MISGRFLSLLITPLMTTEITFAADNPGSHQHGHAELQLAMSGQQVELLLLSPAQNLLGFEYQPRTPEQEELVETVVQWFNETPLINTPTASCTLASVDLHSDFAGNTDGHESGGHGQHADFEISQVLDCPGLQDADALTTPLTERFPGLEHLEVAWTGPDGQGAVELGHGDNQFSPRP